MYIYFWFLISFLVVNGFLFLDEELLIIMASIAWLDAAGGFIRNALWSELEDRGTKIKAQFEWFLNSKRNLTELVLSFHKKRVSFAGDLGLLYNYIIHGIVYKVICLSLKTSKILKIFVITHFVRKLTFEGRFDYLKA